MVKLSERFSFQALTDALGSLGRFERTDVTRRYERKQIILNVTSSALLGSSRSHVVSMTSKFLTLRAEPGVFSSIANLDVRRTASSALSGGSIASTAAHCLPSCCER